MPKSRQLEAFPCGAVLRKRNGKFKPDREYIQKKTEEFLSAGGEIDVLEPEPEWRKSYVYRSQSQDETIYEYRL